MIGNTGKFVAMGLMLAGIPAMATAQENNSTESYEVSSLRLSSLPIPTSRADALGTAPESAKQPKIRRTTDGIRIVGPVFFPEDRN